MSTSTVKVALLTGSTSEIGCGTALEFARLGYRLCFSGRSETAMREIERECKAAGAEKVVNNLERRPKAACCFLLFRLVSVIGDLTDAKVAERLIEATIATFGSLDILINSAGIGVFGNVANTTISQFDSLFNINVRM